MPRFFSSSFSKVISCSLPKVFNYSLPKAVLSTPRIPVLPMIRLKPTLGLIGATAVAATTYSFASFSSEMRTLKMMAELPRTIDDRKAPLGLSTKERIITASEAKEWLIIGRQSPAVGLVRDEEKTPKDELRSEIKEKSSLKATKLAAVMDNEKHYNLFPDSDFVLERFTGESETPLIRLKPEHMCSHNWTDIKDDALYETAFARKQGFADFTSLSPLFHSALGFREVSPTRLPNPNSVLLTGSEIKNILRATDKNICHVEHCALYNSNCYTAAVYAIVEMMVEIDKRSGNKERNNQDILKLAHFIPKTASDNFGQGLYNNRAVRRHLSTTVPEILQRRGLWKGDTLHEDAEEASELWKRLSITE